jgi:hypothetical protein
MKRERESDELILNAPPTKKMKWDVLCSKLGISIDTHPPKNADVVDAIWLEEFLNMAFCIVEDHEDFDTDTERVLEEDYDW